MIEPSHDTLSIKAQCRLLSISRSGLYYAPRGESPLNLQLMRLIDEQFLITPFMAAAKWHDTCAGRAIALVVTVRRLMRLMGLRRFIKSRRLRRRIRVIIYPYLLRNLAITRPNQVWCTDITYIPIKRGFLYLVAIMDWYSR